jgi:hypothetical protein
LDADTQTKEYSFAYIRGAKKAHEEAEMSPLAEFPDFYRKYEAESLFPLFQNRILSPSREDFSEYVRWMDLNPSNADPLEILAVSEGRRLTDNLEVFPLILREPDGGFRCRFFLHGWRHVCECAHNKIEQLQVTEPLRVSIELNNPVTVLAVQISTSDYHMVGWSPRYLVNDLVNIMSRNYQSIDAKVIKVNPKTAPSQQRILVEISGVWPKDYEPMSTDDYQFLNS